MSYVTNTGTFKDQTVGAEKVPHFRETPYNGGGHARITVTSAHSVVQGADQACDGVFITAHRTNSDVIAVGFSSSVRANDVLSTDVGLPLEPGSTIFMSIDNTNRIYIDAKVSGEGALLTWVRST